MKRPAWTKPSEAAPPKYLNRLGSIAKSSHLASSHHRWKHRSSHPNHPCPIHNWRIPRTRYWSSPAWPRYWSSPAWPMHWSSPAWPMHWSSPAWPTHWSSPGIGRALIGPGIGPALIGPITLAPSIVGGFIGPIIIGPATIIGTPSGGGLIPPNTLGRARRSPGIVLIPSLGLCPATLIRIGPIPIRAWAPSLLRRSLALIILAWRRLLRIHQAI